MAKKSMIARDAKRKVLIAQQAEKRAAVKAVALDKNLTVEERFVAQLKLARMDRNASPTRHKNRCSVTGRPRGYYRKFGVSRIALRELGSQGRIPGIIKSSW